MNSPIEKQEPQQDPQEEEEKPVIDDILPTGLALFIIEMPEEGLDFVDL